MRAMIRTEESRRVRSTAACLVSAALALIALAACGPKRGTIVSATRTVTVHEARLAQPAMVDISVVDLHDEPATDPRMEKVVGTIVNHGDKPVSRLTIRVDSLDDAGNLVNSVTTPPLAETVAALGGRASFEASIPRNVSVTTYHAVAVAQ
jgi:hypothetical protein